MNKSISQELKLLRSLAISIVGKDSEGSYKPEYVRRALFAARKKPNRKFISERQFLAELKRA